MRASTFLSVVALVLAGCGDKKHDAASVESAAPKAVDAGWRLFEPAGAGFSVRMPAPPTVTKSELPLDIVQNTATYATAAQVFEIVWMELPPGIDGNDVFNRNIEAMKAGAEGVTLESEKEIETGGHKGKEVVFKRADRDHVARMFWIAPRYYLLEAGGASPEQREAYLGSFKIAAAPPATSASAPAPSSSAAE